MEKSGQFTLFIVLGVVLVALIGMVYVYRAEIFSLAGFEELALPSEVNEISDDVASCVGGNLMQAVVDVSLNGGYYNLPTESYSDDTWNVPYYLYDGSNMVLSLDGLQTELESYINVLTVSCLDLNGYTDFVIEAGEISSSVEITEGLVEASVSYPLVVTKGDNVYTLNKPYETSVDANLYSLRNIAEEIVLNDLESDSVDYGNLADYELSKISVVPLNGDTILYILDDETAFNNEITLSFRFAEYYPGLEAVDCISNSDCESEETCVDSVCEVVEE
ncbi:hypothetical protein J4467_02430 [Candidatus Woesearchaeota archaeon]|nr:hypothetical protein [Candidatus Woesearchaeota archaeon]